MVSALARVPELCCAVDARAEVRVVRLAVIYALRNDARQSGSKLRSHPWLRDPRRGLSAGRRNRWMLAERIGLRTRRFVDWIQRRIEAQAPFARGSDGYFWVIWRIDDVANLSGDRLSTAVVESAIVARGQGRGGGCDRLTRTRNQAICAHITRE